MSLLMVWHDTSRTLGPVLPYVEQRESRAVLWSREIRSHANLLILLALLVLQYRFCLLRAHVLGGLIGCAGSSVSLAGASAVFFWCVDTH